MSSADAGDGLGGDTQAGEVGAGFAATYRLARSEAVLFDRSHRGRLLVSGRAPGQMLGGVLTGRIPLPLSVAEGSEFALGSRAYSAMLTPKGKMLSDLYVYRLPGEEEAFLLDVPPSGLEAVLEHFGKVLPPRLARFHNASDDYRFTTVAGPAAGAAVGTLLSDQSTTLDVNPSTILDGTSPDDVIVAGGIVIALSADLSVPSFDMMVPTDAWDMAHASLSTSGAAPAGTDVWNALRVEAGTPEFGTDMGADTIPLEAGIDQRAVDHDKGCYTGQEVIVRIRHRGHVNRHLRTLTLASDQAAPGDALFQVGGEKAVGSITSLARSPAVGGTVALGYVRREVELGSDVLVGGVDGPRATVLELGPVA